MADPEDRTGDSAASPNPSLSAGAQRVVVGLSAILWLCLSLPIVLPLPGQLWSDLARGFGAYLAVWGLALLLSSHRVRTCRRFVLASFSLLGILCCMEALVFLRLADFRALLGTHLVAPWYSTKNVLDPKLVHIHRPYLKETVSGPGDSVWGLPARNHYSFSVACDRNGFRNDRDLERADIAVIGDSFIEGHWVQSPDLLTSQLARQSGLAVVNLGQSWYGPQQESVVLARFALPLQPKICVLTFFEGNDLPDTLRYESVVKDWKGFVARLNGRRERSATVNLVRWFKNSLTDPDARSPKLWTARYKSPQGEQDLHFLYPISGSKDSREQEFEHLRRAYSEAYESCRENGITLVVVFAPSKSRIYFPFCEFAPGSPYRDWGDASDPLPAEFAALIRSISPDIHLIDLVEVSTQAAREGRLVYFPDDSHWNSEGHRLVATAIHDYLKSHNLLPAPLAPAREH